MSRKYIFAIAFVIVLVLLLTAAAVVADRRDGKNIEEPVTDTVKDAEEPFSVLVLGRDKVSGLTDVMMLVSVVPDGGRICVMQIPRDTYAEYSDGHKKLNSAVKVLGSEKKLCQFLESSLGVKIDGYVSVDLEGFRKAVDAIGGVDMELDRTFYYNDPAQGLYIYLQKGKQHLDGKKAEMLVRYRSGYVRGDLDRLDMQKQFLSALFTATKNAVSLSNAYSLAKSLFPHVDTDLTLPELVELGLGALKTDIGELGLLTMPGEDARTESNGASYYVMSARPTRKILDEYFVTDGKGIDQERLFEHPSNNKFKEIYGREGNISPTLADNLS